MKFKVTRLGIDILPENEQDEAYIEDTLGLTDDNQAILLVRQNAHGLACISNLSTHPFPKKHIKLTEVAMDRMMVEAPEKIAVRTKCKGLMTKDQIETCAKMGSEPYECCPSIRRQRTPTDNCSCSCHD